MPAVSVIIPAFRVTEYIGETLDSIFAQTFPDFEVIVVNDGCPDTPALERALAPYLDRIVYLQQENAGPSAARNAGIRAARGEFVALLDGDDAWEPDYLECQVGFLRANPAIDVVYPNGVIVGDSAISGKLLMDFNPSEGEVTFASLVKMECTVLVSVTARKEAIVRAGMFDPEFHGSEDFDLWLRVVAQGGKIAYHRRALLRYRRRAVSQSSDSAWMRRCALRVLDKAERTLRLSAEDKEALSHARLRFQADVDYFEGKRAFAAGDLASARRSLSAANRYLHSPKLALALALLRYCPWLMRFVRPRGPSATI